MGKPVAVGLMVLALLLMGNRPSSPTYAAGCSIPPTSFGKASDGISHLRPVLIISISESGALRWAGIPVSVNQLRWRMRRVGDLDPVPLVILDAHAKAPCDQVAEVRSAMLASASCMRGRNFCSEGQNWREWRQVGGP